MLGQISIFDFIKSEPQKGNNIKYTGYCTCFTDITEGVITACFWDEIKDIFIKQIKCESENEANEIKKNWADNKPKNVICDLID